MEEIQSPRGVWCQVGGVATGPQGNLVVKPVKLGDGSPRVCGGSDRSPGHRKTKGDGSGVGTCDVHGLTVHTGVVYPSRLGGRERGSRRG